jgi:hypothetical protein
VMAVGPKSNNTDCAETTANEPSSAMTSKARGRLFISLKNQSLPFASNFKAGPR